MSAGRHVVVTGAAGYIGSLLTSELLREGDYITAIDSCLSSSCIFLVLLSDKRTTCRLWYIAQANRTICPALEIYHR